MLQGDYCQSNGGRYTLYANNNLPGANNGSNTDYCTFPNASGLNFSPLESHGVTIQEGDDGNTDALPTYWFWHPWACAGNKTGCPWIGHSNASRLLQNWIGVRQVHALSLLRECHAESLSPSRYTAQAGFLPCKRNTSS